MMKKLLVFIFFVIPLLGWSQTYDRANLKERFETGDVPTQQDFSDLIDSFQNLNEDGSSAVDTVNDIATKYDLTQIEGGGGNYWPLSGNFNTIGSQNINLNGYLQFNNSGSSGYFTVTGSNTINLNTTGVGLFTTSGAMTLTQNGAAGLTIQKQGNGAFNITKSINSGNLNIIKSGWDGDLNIKSGGDNILIQNGNGSIGNITLDNQNALGGRILIKDVNGNPLKYFEDYSSNMTNDNDIPSVKWVNENFIKNSILNDKIVTVTSTGNHAALKLTTSQQTLTGPSIRIGENTSNQYAGVQISNGSVLLHAKWDPIIENRRFTFLDLMSTPRGIEYSGSGYVTQPHSLADKEYVDSYKSGSLTDGAPSSSQLNSVIGVTPATAGAGHEYKVKDTDGSGQMYIVVSDGSNWHYSPMNLAN